MKKERIGISVVLLLVICLVFRCLLLLINYIIALVLHELAHVYVAGKRGYHLKQFKLDLFGLQVDLDREVEDKDAFWVNLAGPLFNLFLCLICLALYWIFPNSYNMLNNFCFANLVLAMFNLLPIYPLDGGKIFRGMIKSDKAYKICDKSIRIGFTIIFLALFVTSIFHKVNWFYLLFALFFIFSKGKAKPTFSIFKPNKNKSVEKVNLVKVSGEDNLFTLIKRIKKSSYTIFYYPQAKKYIDEDTVLELALKHPLTTPLKDLNLN